MSRALPLLFIQCSFPEELVDLFFEPAVTGPPDEGDNACVEREVLRRETVSMTNWKGNFFIRYADVNNF